MSSQPDRSLDDIPIAHTPLGGYGDRFPSPILTGCTDALIDDALHLLDLPAFTIPPSSCCSAPSPL